MSDDGKLVMSDPMDRADFLAIKAFWDEEKRALEAENAALRQQVAAGEALMAGLEERIANRIPDEANDVLLELMNAYEAADARRRGRRCVGRG